MPDVKPMTMPQMTACSRAVASLTLEGKYDFATMVKDVFAAYYRERYGPAPGSTAFQASTGRSAVRYFDSTFDCYRWIVYDSPNREKLTGTRDDALPGVGWKVSERPWQELIYR